MSQYNISVVFESAVKLDLDKSNISKVWCSLQGSWCVFTHLYVSEIQTCFVYIPI